MRPGGTWRLAWRYFRGHLKRYIFLLVITTFGLGIISLTTALTDGMRESVISAARLHYGGDLFIMGMRHQGEDVANIRNIGGAEDALIASGLGSFRWIKRTNVFADGIVHHEGVSSRQKNIYGVDWDAEMSELSGLFLVEGSLDNLSDDKHLILSEQVAGHLNAQTGDEVVIQVLTLRGQVNTGKFEVKAIYKDASIFGFYKSYVSRIALNRLVDLPIDACTSIGIYLDSPSERSDNIAETVRKHLNDFVGTTPLAVDKDHLHQISSQVNKGVGQFVVTLDVYVSQVADLLLAMNIVSYAVFAMMAIIIIVSVNVTYRLVILERSREIGTLRAIGMQRPAMIGVYLVESLILGGIAIVFGILFAVFLRNAAALIDFDWIPGFEIFTRKGRLWGVFHFRRIVMNVVILMTILLPSVVVPVFRFSRKEVVSCLAE